MTKSEMNQLAIQMGRRLKAYTTIEDKLKLALIDELVMSIRQAHGRPLGDNRELELYHYGRTAMTGSRSLAGEWNDHTATS